MPNANVDILNAIRAKASPDYQNRIPEATKDNLKKVAMTITEYEPSKNEFLHSLMNRIALVVLRKKLFNNPLRNFKKGTLAYGTDIEEIFVNIAKAHTFNPERDEDLQFKREIADVQTRFHRFNRADFYKVTISENQLTNAFLNEYGMRDLIGTLTDSLYNGDNQDEYLIMKNLLTKHIDSTDTYNVHVDSVTNKETAENLLVEVRSMAGTLPFYASKYNPAGVTTFTKKEEMILFVTPRTKALMDVKALAAAFHLDKADVEFSIVEVDNFGDSEKAKSTVAVLTDSDFFVVYDKMQKFTEAYNAQGLYWNYFFHHWETISSSQFSNFVRFTTDAVGEDSVTSVTLSPKKIENAEKGLSYDITAKVVKTGNASEAVAWEVNSTLSTVQDGVLYINKDETMNSLTVTAKAISNPDVSDTCTITIKQ